MNLDLALSVLLIFGAACYVLMGSALMASKREFGSVPIGILFVVLSIWVMSGAVELLATTFNVFSIGRTGHFVGTALGPVVAYVCFRGYTGYDTPRWTIALMLFLPSLTIGLAATNMLHELMWSMPHANEAGEFLTRPERWGPWFLFVHVPYSYAVMGAAMLTLLIHCRAVARAQRRGLLLLVASCIAPLVATAAYDFGYGPDTVSYIPFVFAAMLPVYAWLILGEKLVEFTPLAYETVFQNMLDPVVVIDDNCRVIGLNHTAESMLSVDEAHALREPLESLFGDDAPEVFEALNSGKPQKMLTTTGRFLHVQVSPISNNRSSVRGGKVLMFRDVSDVERAQTEVRKSEKLLRTLIDHSVNGIIRFRWVREDDGQMSLRSIFANAAAGRFLAANVDELVGCTARGVVELATSGMDEHAAAAAIQHFERAIASRDGLDTEVRQGSSSGGRWLRLICEPVGDDFAATFVDISDAKAREHQMESIATSDPLTGVMNRRGFERDGSRRLTDSPDDATGALLFIDLNDFKQINDKYGHEVGDQLLVIAAERLKKSLRSGDIIGRPGGDEFVALVPDVDAETADKLAKRLSSELEETYRIGRELLRCPASIGLALYPKNANTLTGLLREADRAMYRAKARNRGVSNVSGKDLLEKAI